MTPRQKLIAEIEEVLAGYGLNYAQVRTPSRKQPDVIARDHAIYHVWKTRYHPRFMSLVKIGNLFDRDHTSTRIALGRHMRRHGIPHKYVDEVEALYGLRPRMGPRPYVDIAGKRYGRLVAEKRIERGFWICRCDCGGTTKAFRADLEKGSRKTCGCSAHGRIDLTGKRFGRLTVKHYAGNRRWACVCDCGATTNSDSYGIRSGEIKSCGCYSRDLRAQRSLATRGAVCLEAAE